jgi:plastocyanin
MTVRVAFVIPLSALMIACGRNGSAPADIPMTPVAASAVIAAPGAASTVGARATLGRQDVVVNMQDACDPDTFNAPPRGANTCVRAGGVTFDQFIAQLTRLGLIGSWRFAPSIANVQVGQTFVATNRGGEVHTFTEVAEFGGGIVPVLNDLAHVPNVAPECNPNVLEPDDFVPSGGTYRETIEHTGRLKFQCCIHPWMRMEASSR